MFLVVACEICGTIGETDEIGEPSGICETWIFSDNSKVETACIERHVSEYREVASTRKPGCSHSYIKQEIRAVPTLQYLLFNKKAWSQGRRFTTRGNSR